METDGFQADMEEDADDDCIIITTKSGKLQHLVWVPAFLLCYNRTLGEERRRHGDWAPPFPVLFLEMFYRSSQHFAQCLLENDAIRSDL